MNRYATGPTMAILRTDFAVVKRPCDEKMRCKPFSGLMRSGFGIRGCVVRIQPDCIRLEPIPVIIRSSMNGSRRTITRKPTDTMSEIRASTFSKVVAELRNTSCVI